MSRIAVVTGGTHGIGAATANALQAEGYKVAAAAAAFNKETSMAIFGMAIFQMRRLRVGWRTVSRLTIG
jgi:acetoacetyl-CoA reductase